MVEKKNEEITRRKFITGTGLAAFGVAAGGVLGVAKPSFASVKPVNLLVNGKSVNGAKIENNKALAPVREVAETMGAEVSWDNSNKTVSISGKAQADALPAWPWPYKKLNVEKVRKRGYENYFKGGCMFGAAAALVETLREEVGRPYTEFPSDFFRYGAGGAAGWGTLCGALNGACFVFNMVTKDFSKLTNEDRKSVV